MLMFLYLCTGFSLAVSIVALAHVVAFAWHGVKKRLETGESANLKGRFLVELVVGWVVLGISISVVILLSTLYPK